MPDALLEAYIQTLAIVLSGTLVAFLALHAPAAVREGLAPRAVPVLLGGTALIFGLWFAIGGRLARQGVLGQEAFPGGPPAIGLVVLLGALAIYALARGLPAARAVTDRIDQRYLMGFQGFRVLGGIFLVGLATGQIPALFAIPAGLGDIAAGLLGLRAMRAVASGAPDAMARVRLANYWGIGDFAVALGTGMVTAQTAFQLTAFDNPNIIGFYPLVMIPAMFVPMFLAVHLLSLRRLAAPRAAAA